MATEREFRLTGSFDDQITKKLKKINSEVGKLSRSFDKFNKRLAPVTKGMNKFADASMRANKALKNQKTGFESSLQSARQYTTQMRKAYSTAEKLSKVKPPKAVPMGRAQGTRPGGGGGGGMAAGVAGGVAGVGLGNMLTGAILRGFDMGWNILKAPFGFIRRGLAERIADEMSDVRAAGGLFSISKRMDSPFVKDFAAAEALTKDTNRYLAELAGALPGDTQEYINVSKQISDGIYTVIANDKENAIKFGQELAKGRGADTAAFKGGGAEAMQAAGKELVGEMTKLTVLAGLGGRQGAFGLPQLTEQMISKDKVTLASFSKYAAIFRDPLIKGALERNIEEINKSGKNTTERLKALRATFSEIVTPSLVKRYQRTTEGVIESLKSTFLNPEVGLLGLGRPLNIMATKFDEFGQAVEKDGKVVTEALSLFDYFRDIFANLMIVMEPVLAVVGKLFDPFEKMGMSLQKIRKATMAFQLSFEQFTQFFKDQGDTFSATSIPLRGALSAITEALAKLGVIGQEEIDKFVAIIKDPKAGFKEFGAMLQEMISKFLNSDGAAKIGEAIGGIIGSVVSTVGNLMAQVSGLATSGPLAKGFTDGFNAAGGPKGIANVFKSVFALFGKIITDIFKAAPLESAILAGVVLLPGIISAAVGGLVTKVVSSIGSMSVPMPKLPVSPNRIKGRPQVMVKKAVDSLASPIKKFKGGLGQLNSALKYGAQETRAGSQMLKMGQWKEVLGVFKGGNIVKGLRGFGSALGKGVRTLGKFGGALTAIFGIFDVITGLFSGKDIWESLASASGPVIGTILGAALGGPIGAVIGGILGEMLMKFTPVVDTLTGIFKGVGEVFGAVFETLGPIVESVGTIFGDLFGIAWELFSVFNPLAGVVEGVAGEMGTVALVVKAVKIILWPIVGAFQLLEQVLNVVVLAFKGIKTAVIGAQLGLSKLNPFANKEKQAKLEAEYQQSIKETQQSVARFGESFERHKKYYQDATPSGSVSKSVDVKLETNVEGSSWGEQFGGWWNKNFTAFTEALNKEWSKFTNFFTETIPSLWSQAVSTTKNLLSQEWNKIVEFYTDTIPNTWNASINGLIGTVKTAWDGLVNFFTNTIPYAIGFAIGKLIKSFQQTWDGLVNFFTNTIPNTWNASIDRLIGTVEKAWDGLVNFFTNTVPYAIGFAIGKLIKSFQQTWDGLVNFFTNTIPNIWNNAVDSLTSMVLKVWNKVVTLFTETIPRAWNNAVDSLTSMVLKVWNNVVTLFTKTIPNIWKNAINRLMSTVKATWDGLVNFFTNTIPNAWNSAINGLISFATSVWDNLVVFFMETVPNWFSTTIGTFISKSIDALNPLWTWFIALPGQFVSAATNFLAKVPGWINILGTALQKIGTAVINWAKSLPSQLGNALKNMGSSFWSGMQNGLGDTPPDGPNGGSGTRFQSIASGHGLEMTSFMRPGDQGSYHSIGRAMDFSNSTGPTTEMMAFAGQMVNTYGKNLKELIYTPLGFSIKNGMTVPPMSPDNHYNHVHVAWNKGNVGPLMEEMRYKPQGSTLGVANSSETVLNTGQTALLSKALQGGGGTVINNNIQIDGAQDPDAVAAAILNAMKQMEQSTIS